MERRWYPPVVEERRVVAGVVTYDLERLLRQLVDRADGWVEVPIDDAWSAYLICGSWAGKGSPLPHILGAVFLPRSVPPSRPLNSTHLRSALSLDTAPDEVLAEAFRGSLALVGGSLERRDVTPERWEQLQEAIRNTRSFEKKLRSPKRGQHKEEDFFPRLALLYLNLVNEGGPRRIAVRLYEHLNSEGFDGTSWSVTSPQAVSDYLRACREKGYLPKPGKGKSAREPTPKLLDWQASQQRSARKGKKR